MLLYISGTDTDYKRWLIFILNAKQVNALFKILKNRNRPWPNLAINSP